MFSDLSGYVKYSLAEVMGSASALSLCSYLLPSTHLPINIKGVTGEQKYTSKLSQMSLKQLQSKQVNIYYIPSPRERLRPVISSTD